MALGRPLVPLTLTDGERDELERWTRRPKTAQGLALRARIVLLAAGGKSNTEIAAQLGVTGTTVGKWRQRYLLHRSDGLFDEPRPGVPRTISDAQVEALIVRTLETAPADGTHWSNERHGEGDWPQPEYGQPHLASLLPPAPSLGDLQTLD